MCVVKYVCLCQWMRNTVVFWISDFMNKWRFTILRAKMNIPVYRDIHIYIHAHIHTFTYSHAKMNLPLYIYIYIYTYIYLRTYPHTFTYSHAHAHTINTFIFACLYVEKTRFKNDHLHPFPHNYPATSRIWLCASSPWLIRARTAVFDR